MIIDDAVVQSVLNYLTRQPYRYDASSPTYLPYADLTEEVQELVSSIINEVNKHNIKNEPELPLENVGGRSS